MKQQVHQLSCVEPWFSLLKSGQKPVEGRMKEAMFDQYCLGDIIEFSSEKNDDRFTVRITQIKTYPSLEEYLNTVTIEKAVPGTRNIAEAMAVYHQWYTPQQIQQNGFLGIFVERI